MNNLETVLQQINSLVWGAPLLIGLVGTGVYFSIKLNLLQVLKLPLALKYLFTKNETSDDCEGDISSFGALCTALASTIGTGNIVGVATAIKAGGPGALFWMWVAGFFGMATKYSECLLAVKYRVVDENGQMSGGPMYYIERGMGNKWLAKLFALFGIGVAFFGIGTFPQVNAIATSVQTTFNVPILITSIIITLLVALVTLKGIKSISKMAEILVPFMVIVYVFGSLIIIGLNIELLPAAINLVIKSAFTPTAAAGGFLGASVMFAIRNGVARGVFSNESGLGSAPIATAAAKTNSCVEQGLISMTGTFFDTIIVCTMTGLILILTGQWSGSLEGADMTNAAFNQGLPVGGTLIVTIGLILFAFTTILGWNYYGERCTEYLFGVRAIKTYRIIFIALVGLSPLLKLNTIWILADIVNGLMAIPNLIALFALREIVITETKSYFGNITNRVLSFSHK
ncbi:MAG: sodium:alanine symporter family protein [Tissierellaceae bacterium]|nr:sodium:alanine symporter family protein [Tissierellaceae bacterium]